MSTSTTNSQKLFFSVLFCISALCVLLMYVFNSASRDNINESITSDINDLIKSQSLIISKAIQQADHDVRFLHSTPPVKGILRAYQNNGIDPVENNSDDVWKRRLEKIFTGFLENNTHIAQARLIGVDNNGLELVRVERVDNNIRTVPKNRLQEKGHTNYFTQTTLLPEGHVYISDITLNREGGRVEFPHWSTYRAALPIYSAENILFGFIIINFYADPLFNSMENNIPKEYTVYLLNSDDYFLYHNNKKITENIEYGFEFGLEKTWDTRFKIPPTINTDRTKLIKTTENTNNKSSLYQKTEIPLESNILGRKLKIIAMISEDKVSELLEKQQGNAPILLAVLYVISIIILGLYQLNIHRKIQASETSARFVAIFNSSVDAIIAIDNTSKITNWNYSAENMFGYSLNSIKGEDIFKLLRISNIDGSELKNTTSHNNSARVYEAKAFHKNSNAIDVSITLSPIRSDQNGIIGSSIILRDISQQKIFEEKISTLNSSLERQVEERTKELEQARNQAISANKAKSDFVSNISHEIRTPMNGVMGMLHLILREPLSPQQKEHIRLAQSSASTMLSLINDILDFSKIESGKLNLEDIEVDLIDILSDTMSALSTNGHTKLLDLVLNLSDLHNPRVMADPHRITQIFTNLIGNAIKFTPEGSVELFAKTVTKENNRVTLECCIKDTGIGISKEQQKRLFHAFTQADNSTTRRFGGSGLGLNITRQLVEMMGGSIRVESELNKGSEFYITLEFEGCIPSTPTENYNLDRQKIIVAEKNSTARTALVRLLATHNANTLSANNSTQVEDRIKELNNEPATIIISNDIFSDIIEKNIINNIPESCRILVMHNIINQDTIDLIDSKEIPHISTPIQPKKLLRVLLQKNLKDEDQQYSKNKLISQKQRDYLINTHVLVVDDNVINHEVAKGLLEDLGIPADNIQRAFNGIEAIDILSKNENPPKVVFMDCHMPVLDGFGATAKIRAGDAGEHVKEIVIIAITASAMSGDRDHCIEVGMNDFLAKPLEPDSLARKLFSWLSRDPKQSDNIISAPKNEYIPRENAEEPHQNIKKLPLTDDIQTHLSDREIWKKEEFLKRVRGRQDRLEILVKMYLESADDRLAILKELIDSSDFAKLSQEAHSLKGVTANLSGERCYYLSCKLEAAANQNDSNYIAELWPLLNTASEEFKQELKSAIGSTV